MKASRLLRPEGKTDGVDIEADFKALGNRELQVDNRVQGVGLHFVQGEGIEIRFDGFRKKNARIRLAGGQPGRGSH